MLLMEGSALFFPIIHQHHGISEAFIFGSQYARLVYGDKEEQDGRLILTQVFEKLNVEVNTFVSRPKPLAKVQ